MSASVCIQASFPFSRIYASQVKCEDDSSPSAVDHPGELVAKPYSAAVSYTSPRLQNTPQDAIPSFGGTTGSGSQGCPGWGLEKVPTPKQLMKELDKFVIGQHKGKKVGVDMLIAVDVYCCAIYNQKMHIKSG